MSKERQRAKWAGFTNFQPNEAEQKAIKKDKLNLTQFVDAIARLADDGYKVSFRFDDYRKALVVELFAYYADTKNAGRTLVMAHHDPVILLSGITFFMEKIADGGVWPQKRELDNPYDW